MMTFTCAKVKKNKQIITVMINQDVIINCYLLDIDECTEDIVIIADTLEEAQLQYNESLSSSGDDFSNLPWCQQGCVNTNGSYECDCKEGYYLDTEDNSTCIGMAI